MNSLNISLLDSGPADAVEQRDEDGTHDVEMRFDSETVERTQSVPGLTHALPALLQTPARPLQPQYHLGPVHQAYGAMAYAPRALLPHTPNSLSFIPHLPAPTLLPYPLHTSSLPRQPPPFEPPLQASPSPTSRSSRSARLQLQRDAPVRPVGSNAASATDGVAPLVAASFASGLFAGIKLDKVSPHRPHLWYQHVDDEDQILVVLRCIEACNLSLGEFLSLLFDPTFKKHPKVYHQVAAFLRKLGKDDPSPVDVVRRIYEHPKNIKPDDIMPFHSLPRYAWPPQDRRLARPSYFGAHDLTTRSDILDFALQLILKRVDSESDGLLSPQHGLMYLGGRLSWEVLYQWNMESRQALFAQHAPALFAIMSTVAVNKRLRKKLDRSALPVPSTGADSDSDSESDTELSEATRVPPEVLHEAEKKIPKTPRDPWLGVTVAILMLLAFRNRRAIMFGLFIGILLFTCNAHRDIFRLLNRIGLCVAYSTCIKYLSLLADNQSTVIIAWASSFQEGTSYFQLVYDNVNKRRQVWQKTIASRDEVQNGTAATIIRLEDVPPNAMDIELLEKHTRDHPRTSLTYTELRQDIDWKHLEGVGAGTVLRVWLQWIPSLAHHRSRVEHLFKEEHQKHRLPLRKSEIQTLRCSGIDESTTEGANRVLKDTVLDQLRLSVTALAKRLLFVCGDQLTINHVRKLKTYFSKAKTPVERLTWARPIIQLWHMKWAWQKDIVKLNWSNISQLGTYGLRADAIRLERHKYNPVKCDFHQTHHLLRDTFETLVLDALRLLCEEETKVVHPTTTHLLSGLEQYFSGNGPLADCSFEKLQDFARRVYDRHLCVAAHEDALGHAPRDETLYGPSVDFERPVLPVADESTHEDSDDPRTWHGDRLLANTINFMRQTFWYIEFCAAVSEGDIGRVFEIIKVLRFSFWGAGSTNYGNELLELACNFMKEYPPALCIALLNNYLVNPSGLPGHWHEIDLLQEHFNFWLKRLYQSKSMSFESRFLKEVVGLNLCGFNKFRNEFTRIFGLKQHSGFHPDKKRTDDVNRLGDSYREHSVLRFAPGRTQAYTVRNEFEDGVEKLYEGKLAAFLQRTSEQSHGESVDEDTDRTEDLLSTPANPIISSDGLSSLSDFVDIS